MRNSPVGPGNAVTVHMEFQVFEYATYQELTQYAQLKLAAVLQEQAQVHEYHSFGTRRAILWFL